MVLIRVSFIIRDTTTVILLCLNFVVSRTRLPKHPVLQCIRMPVLYTFCWIDIACTHADITSGRIIEAFLANLKALFGGKIISGLD